VVLEAGAHAQPYYGLLERGQKESQLLEQGRKKSARVSEIVLEIMSSWAVYHFHDTSDKARIKQKNYINNNEFLQNDASNLAAFLYKLKTKSPDNYWLIINTIRKLHRSSGNSCYGRTCTSQIPYDWNGST